MLKISKSWYNYKICVFVGYDISVIGYGQSGSGKTYTILGPGLHCALSETEYGIVPRATREIFNRLAVRFFYVVIHYSSLNTMFIPVLSHSL